MEIKRISTEKTPYTALFYCKPGIGKSTAIGLIAEASEGNTLVLDIDRTITKTIAKGDVVKDASKLFVCQVENRGRNDALGVCGTFAAWTQALVDLTSEFIKANDIRTIAVDNVSELERCILSDLGAQGKNNGVPAQADYQYMQFKLVNSLRYMKSLGCNIVWTAWEDTVDFVNVDGTKYSMRMPKISQKIVNNICGLCDAVGWITVDEEGRRRILLDATKNTYAKNQNDTRKWCFVENFIEKKEVKKDEVQVQGEN